MFSERFLQSLLLETSHVLKPNQFLSESSFIVLFLFLFFSGKEASHLFPLKPCTIDFLDIIGPKELSLNSSTFLHAHVKHMQTYIYIYIYTHKYEVFIFYRPGSPLFMLPCNKRLSVCHVMNMI